LKTSPIAPHSNGSSDNSILAIWCSKWLGLQIKLGHISKQIGPAWSTWLKLLYPSFQRELLFFAYWYVWDPSNPFFKPFQEFNRKMKARGWFIATSYFMSLVLCALKSTRWQCLVVERWM
jgi:hypothetical protein